jgi:hypothetical protein
MSVCKGDVAGLRSLPDRVNHLLCGCHGVVVLSAIATGYTNAIIHENRLGFWGAHGLAILVAFFVERFYFVLRHGLTTTYQSDKQRLYALLCYRIIQATMILNCAILTMWIAELPVPPWLEFWNHWSLCVHFGLALLGVQSVRDSDAAVISRSGCDFTKVVATIQKRPRLG